MSKKVVQEQIPAIKAKHPDARIFLEVRDFDSAAGLRDWPVGSE